MVAASEEDCCPNQRNQWDLLHRQHRRRQHLQQAFASTVSMQGITCYRSPLKNMSVSLMCVPIERRGVAKSPGLRLPAPTVPIFVNILMPAVDCDSYPGWQACRLSDTVFAAKEGSSPRTRYRSQASSSRCCLAKVTFKHEAPALALSPSSNIAAISQWLSLCVMPAETLPPKGNGSVPRCGRLRIRNSTGAGPWLLTLSKRTKKARNGMGPACALPQLEATYKVVSLLASEHTVRLATT